jgi:tRNA pseudouridine38-40 synthase
VAQPINSQDPQAKQTATANPKPLSNTPFTGRVALLLSYDGSAYRGWQSQADDAVATVQDSLQQALSWVGNETITVHCAGRTDAGVHASHQVVHFDSNATRSEKSWVRGGNSRLPDSIAIHWARPVSPQFNARHCATARRYRYLILNTVTRSALMPYGVTWENQPLDAERMHQAAQALIGELDFTSYRAAGCQSKTAMRNVHFITVQRLRDFVIIDIQANAFLYHMVRNIAGVLMAIGAGQESVSWAKAVLDAHDRTVAAPTAKAAGLYLVDVTYPKTYGLPAVLPGPYFLPYG